jgi:hypothetical protein
MYVFYEEMIKAQMAEHLAKVQGERPARQLARVQRRAKRRAHREAWENAQYRVALMRSRVARQN